MCLQESRRNVIKTRIKVVALRVQNPVEKSFVSECILKADIVYCGDIAYGMVD